MDVAAVVGVGSLITARVTGLWAASGHEHSTRAEHNASGSATIELGGATSRRVPCVRRVGTGATRRGGKLGTNPLDGV
jgi:hypothetical protein